MKRARPLALVAALVLAPAARAQVDSPFWVDEHLEGYVDCANSKYRALYRLEEFERYDGKRLGKESRYVELRRRWKAERDRVAAEIRTLKADPARRFLFELDQRLEKHAYFRDLERERVDRHAPVFFYVQNAAGARQGLGNFVSNEYGPWLAEFDRLFEEEYVGPEGLEPGRDHGAIPVFVLASHGDYSNYANKIGEPGLLGSLAHYDLDLEMAVIYDDTHGSPYQHKGRHERRRPVLHEMAHRLQHIWYSGPGDFAPQIWFTEGFAEYYSFHLGHTPESLHKHPLDTEALKLLTRYAESDSHYVLPLADLFSAGSYEDVLRAVVKRAQGRPFDQGLAMALFYAQSNLLMHYLHHGLPEGHEDVGRRYVAAALRGRGGLLELKRLLGDLSVEDVEQGFLDYLTAGLDGYIDTRVGAGAAAAPDPAVAAEAAGPTFDPAALQPAADDPETAFALALLSAADGDYDAAAQAIEALLPVADDALRPRLELERRRLDGTRALLYGFLDQAKAVNKRIGVTLDGSLVNARVKEVGPDGVVLESVKIGGKRRFALADLDARELCELMGVSKYRFEPDGYRAYPWAVRGTGAVPREARGEGAEAGEIARDAEADYPARLALANAARGLQELADRGVPADREAADAALAGITALLAESGDLELVTSRRPALRALATLALQRVFESDGLDGALSAPVERLEDGRVRITYEFAAAAELADFSHEPVEIIRIMQTEELEKQRFTIADGALVGREDAVLRHVLPLEAPFKIRAEVNLPEGADDGCFLLLGCRSVTDGGFQATDHTGNLLAYDPRRGLTTDPSQALPASRQYTLELTHDGERAISASVGGKTASQVRSPRAGGELFLWSHAKGTVELRKLVIEGRVSEAARGAARTRWVQDRLQALGLAE